jgi:hypothetical protein
VKRLEKGTSRGEAQMTRLGQVPKYLSRAVRRCAGGNLLPLPPFFSFSVVSFSAPLRIQSALHSPALATTRSIPKFYCTSQLSSQVSSTVVLAKDPLHESFTQSLEEWYAVEGMIPSQTLTVLRGKLVIELAALLAWKDALRANGKRGMDDGVLSTLTTDQRALFAARLSAVREVLTRICSAIQSATAGAQEE